MTVRCTVRLKDLSLGLQKVAVGQSTDRGSPLSGFRVHLMGNKLHLTATDDNIRGAIYHLPVQGVSDVWTVVPPSFHTDLMAAFDPSDQVVLSTVGATVVAQNGVGRQVQWDEGNRRAFTLGCFAGTGSGWRTVEPGRYWLRGDLKPVAKVMVEGRTVQQTYDSSTIFEEVYEEFEYEDFGVASGDLDPMAITIEQAHPAVTVQAPTITVKSSEAPQIQRKTGVTLLLPFKESIKPATVVPMDGVVPVKEELSAPPLKAVDTAPEQTERATS